MRKQSLLIISFVFFSSDVKCGDSTLNIRLFFSGRVSGNHFYFNHQQNSSSTLWIAHYGGVPGFQSGVLFGRNGFNAGIQYMNNLYREWHYIDFDRIKPPQTTPKFDSLYGEVRIHFIEFMFGYEFKLSKKLKISAIGRFGPRAIQGKSATVGRFHQDSFVTGFAQFQPRHSIGFGLNVTINLSTSLSGSFGLHVDRTSRQKVESSSSGPYLQDIPDQNRFINAARYYGANFGLNYTLIYGKIRKNKFN